MDTRLVVLIYFGWMIGLFFFFQATGVAITEVRDAGREENGQGGGVRRLALNRFYIY